MPMLIDVVLIQGTSFIPTRKIPDKTRKSITFAAYSQSSYMVFHKINIGWNTFQYRLVSTINKIGVKEFH